MDPQNRVKRTNKSRRDMKVTHLSTVDTLNPDALSGTQMWISKSLRNQGLDFSDVNLTQLETLLPPLEELTFQIKRWWQSVTRGLQRPHAWYAKRWEQASTRIGQKLKKSNPDVILTSMTPLATAMLETQVPIVYWTDATYQMVLGFYPEYLFHDTQTRRDGCELTERCLQRAARLIFSSHWAARAATELHGIPVDRIRVVPFGPNLDISHSLADVRAMIKARPSRPIKLLFVGKDWYRKGGQLVLDVAATLHAAGLPVELTLVGKYPDLKPLPSYVRCEAYLSKKDPAAMDKLKKLYREAHFLVLPTMAETFGMVFCEASAFGVPSLTTFVGGIPDVVKDHVNGMKFSLEATANDYCDYIVKLMDNYEQYEALALSSFNEYQTRLNWQNAASQVKTILEEVSEGCFEPSG